VWLEGGRKWKCNICGLGNETPSSYFSHLDEKNRRRDRDQRPELTNCSVEFIAPNDYQIRPPQPPTYLFLIDVSPQALLTGMLASAVTSIKAVLSELPGTPRTQVGILTYDTTIQFYNLKASLSSPQMLVISGKLPTCLPT
jgi:protein transport protein SEC24